MSRFRVDPALMRVSLKQYPNGVWRATVTERVGLGRSVYSNEYDAEAAVDIALGLAESAAFCGLDLDMMWSYDHPMRPNE